MENKEALAMLKQAINYGKNGETVTGNWMLGTDNIEAIKLAIKALTEKEEEFTVIQQTYKPLTFKDLSSDDREDLIKALKRMGKQPAVIMSFKMDIAQAMGVLKRELLEDQTPGSYYHGWQSNLACVIVDNSQLNMVQANHIAKHFLSILTSQGE